MKASIVAVALIAALMSPLCRAERVQIPLALDERFIESLLRDRVFTDAGESLRLNDDGSGCQHLVLRQPEVSASDGQVRVQVAARARAGRAIVGGRCLLGLDWSGRLELVQTPVIGEDGRSIALRTASWRVLRADGSTDRVSTTVGLWLEQYLPVDLERTPLDLSEPIGELPEFLALVMTGEDAERLDALVESIAIDGVTVANGRVTVTVGLEAAPVATPPQPPEPTLSDDELARLESQLDRVDAFFTYTIRSLGAEGVEADANALLEVLVELRQELVAILGERQRSARDPARTLFIDAWERLVPTLRTMAERLPDHENALRYLSFIGAGDALRALDELGPAAGIEISSEGLRRLARMLVPADAGDPLETSPGVDPALRRVLGFGQPLPPPRPRQHDDSSWLDWFIPRAVAAETLAPSVVDKLNKWVPKTRDMDTYLPMVRDVLRHVTAEQLRANELDGAYHPLFRTLVLATAWQESCWRQFMVKDDMRVPMQSGTGDLGIMQINARVWRGLYDLHGLRWDIVYNARAGADILDHYLINYAIRHREHQTTGAVDNLARSAYAAYNGGPRQYDRYRRANASAGGKKIDTLFYEKYRAVKSGEELAVTACYGR